VATDPLYDIALIKMVIALALVINDGITLSRQAPATLDETH
jgi:hypothetical protein